MDLITLYNANNANRKKEMQIGSTSKGKLYKEFNSDNKEIGYLIIKPNGTKVTYSIDEAAKAYDEIY